MHGMSLDNKNIIKREKSKKIMKLNIGRNVGNLKGSRSCWQSVRKFSE